MWNVYSAEGVLRATYPTEAEAVAHCLAWASGCYHRQSPVPPHPTETSDIPATLTRRSHG